MPTSHYELYEADGGQWALCARFSAQDEAVARATAETTWVESRIPTVLIEQSLPDSEGQLEIKDIYRSPDIPTNVAAPDLDGNMSGRMAMVAINGIIVGSVGAGLGAVGLGSSPARLPLALLIFLLVSAVAMMVLFRMMVPAAIMLWRNKSSESKRKAAEILMAITSDSTMAAMAETGLKRRRKGAFSHPAGGPIVPQVLKDGLIADGAAGSETAPTTASPSDLLQELIRTQEAALTAFANTTMQALGPLADKMQAFDRYGLNLYIAGAAQELAWREALTAQTLHAILATVLTEQGTSAEVAKSFYERLDTAANRPRFKTMMDAGRAAMVAHIANQPVPPTANITQIMAGWSNPHGKAAAAQRYAVLLTDIIGSTDATRKLGNSGAQRMLRAHNSIVRAALKDCKGEEVKHTGDGILAVFSKPSDAADAAIAIQQDIFSFCRDNPDIPFAIRLGLEYAEGLKDEGEYFGPAFTTIASICDAAGGGDIAATEAVKAQSTGANTKYADLTPSPTAKQFLPGLFKLLWAPKRVLNAPPLEYRHIGTTSTPEQKQTDDF